jgi:hypothetical protein
MRSASRYCLVFALLLAVCTGAALLAPISAPAATKSGEPSAPPAPDAPAAPKAPAVVDVTIDDEGVRVRADGESLALDAEVSGAVDKIVIPKIEISSEGETIVVHKRGPIRIESNTSDVVRMGSNIEISEEDVVQGDVVAIGGHVSVAGRVMGDVVAINGGVHLASTARVNGDAVSIGGDVDKDPGAEVNGETVSIGFGLPGIGGAWKGEDSEPGSKAGDSIFKLMSLLVMMLLVFVVLSFWTDRVRAMGNVLPAKPWRLLLLGMLVWILIVPACVLLVISIIGILFLPVFIALIIVAFIVGLVTVYTFVGERFRPGDAGARPVRQAFFGLLIVHGCSILGTLLGAIFPFLSPLPGALGLFGKVLVFLAMTVGTGAVLYTRFGKRNLVPPPMVAATAPPIPDAGAWSPPAE